MPMFGTFIPIFIPLTISTFLSGIIVILSAKDNYLSHQYLLENSQRTAVIWLDDCVIIFHVQK